MLNDKYSTIVLWYYGAIVIVAGLSLFVLKIKDYKPFGLIRQQSRLTGVTIIVFVRSLVGLKCGRTNGCFAVLIPNS